MIGSPVYEFPYSGHANHPSPLLDHHLTAAPLWNSLPMDNYMYNHPPTFNYHNMPHIPSSEDSNVQVYQVPDSIPLDTILRQLGVDVGSMHHSSYSNSNYFSMPSPRMEFILPQRPRRGRRLVCREVSDSDSELDDCRRCRQHNRRSRRNSNSNDYDSDQNNEPPNRLHHLLGNIRKKSGKGENSTPPSNSGANTNPQWPSVPNPGVLVSPPLPNAGGGMMNPSTQPANQGSGVLAKLFGGGNANTGPASQPPPNMNPTWNPMPGAPPQQGPPPGLNSMWSQMLGAAPPTATAPPQQGPPPGLNSMWSQMLGAAPATAAPPPQQGPPPGLNSMWSQMLGAAPPAAAAPLQQGPPPGLNSMWSQMLGAAPPAAAAPPQQGPPPAMNSMWSQMLGATPPQQGPPPGMNSMWSQMLGAAPPPQQQAPSAAGSVWGNMSRGKLPIA